jgi:shikimate dehydrogenase
LVTASTKLLALIGDPVSHSLSPRLYNSVLPKLGFNISYLAFRVKRSELKYAVQGLKSLNALGFNLTSPYKQEVIPLLDTISEESRLVQAVNIVSIQEGRLLGTNTDKQGFLQSLKIEARFSPYKKRAIILGSGGVVRTLAFALADEKIRYLAISARNLGKIKEILKEIKERYPQLITESFPFCSHQMKNKLKDIDLILNATTLGIKGEEIPIEEKFFHSSLTAFDLVYGSDLTPFLHRAKKKKANIISGIYMLAYQAALNIKIWLKKELLGREILKIAELEPKE